MPKRIDTPENGGNRGRTKGSKNKATGKIKIEFTNELLDKLKSELRYLHTLEAEKRISVLIDMLKYVMPQANLTKEENEIQEIVFSQMLRHYKKFDQYFSHIPMEKRINQIMKLIKYFSPHQRQQIHEDILHQLKRMNGRYK